MNAPTSSNQPTFRNVFGPKAAGQSIDVPIGDITTFSTVDYPGKIAGVFYTQGCQWRCRFCYNSPLQKFTQGRSPIPFKDIEDFLSSRKGLLEAIVLCGGEPTTHPDLDKFMMFIKKFGYEIGLHTSGMNPDILKGVLKHCGWVAMDIKAPFEDYEKITKIKNSGDKPKDSVRHILNSGIDYEFHTVFHPRLLSEVSLLAIGKTLKDFGVENYTLRTFQEQGCIDSTLIKAPVSEDFPSLKTLQELKNLFKNFHVIR